MADYESGLNSPGSGRSRTSSKRQTQVTTSLYSSTIKPIALGGKQDVDFNSAPNTGAVPAPMPGSMAFEKAQQLQQQRLMDETVCCLLRRKGAEQMRSKILTTLREHSEKATDSGESFVWEGLMSAVQNTQTQDSAMSYPKPLQDAVGACGLTDEQLTGRSLTQVLAAQAAAPNHIVGDVRTGGARAGVSVGCNTIDRGQNEKEMLLAQLQKNNRELEMALDDSKRETLTLKKQLQSMKQQNSTLQQQLTHAQASSITSVPSVSSDQLVNEPSQGDSRGSDATPTTSPRTNIKSGRGSTTPPSLPAVQPPTAFGFGGVTERVKSPQPSVSASPANYNNVESRYKAAAKEAGNSKRSTVSRHSLQRFQTQLKEMKVKLNAIRTGVKGFAFADVISQFSNHVMPPIQNLQASKAKLVDRNFMLEKVCLDFLSRVGTMPDAASPEGYLPEGYPLHVGSYSLMEERKFNDWIERLQSAFNGKATRIQSYVEGLRLENSAKAEHSSSGSRREVVALEDRCAALETVCVDLECSSAANIVDILDTVTVQASRKIEYQSLTRSISDTNEEVRVASAAPNWAGKSAPRVKVNIWRQRRGEAFTRCEQMLVQELQHFVQGTGPKAIMRGRISQLRDLSILMNRLVILPSARQSALSEAFSGSPVSSPTPGATAVNTSNVARSTTSVGPFRNHSGIAISTKPRHQRSNSNSSDRGANNATPPIGSPTSHSGPATPIPTNGGKMRPPSQDRLTPSPTMQFTSSQRGSLRGESKRSSSTTRLPPMGR